MRFPWKCFSFKFLHFINRVVELELCETTNSGALDGAKRKWNNKIDRKQKIYTLSPIKVLENPLHCRIFKNLLLQSLIRIGRSWQKHAACSSLHHVYRSYSSKAYRWHVNDNVNSQVGQGCCICRVVYIHNIRIAICVRKGNKRYCNQRGLSLKIFLWQLTPVYHKTCGTKVVCGYRVRGSGWNWKENRKIFAVHHKISWDIRIQTAKPITRGQCEPLH